MTGASGKWRVSSVDVASYSNGQTGGKLQTLPCDLVAMSGGFSPVLHLFAQSGGKACWNDEGLLPAGQARAGGSEHRRRGRRSARCGSRSMRAWKPRRQRFHRCAARVAQVAKPSKAHCSRWAGRQPRSRGTRAEAVRRLPERRVGRGHPAGRTRRLRVGRAREALHGDGLRHRGKLGNINGMAILAGRSARRFRKRARRRSARTTRRCRSARSRPRRRFPRSDPQDLRARVARRARRAVRGRRQLEAAVVLPEERRGSPCGREARMPRGAQQRRHPRRVDARQDRHPGSGRGEAAELDVHEPVEQARSGQVPLRADARRTGWCSTTA